MRRPPIAFLPVAGLGLLLAACDAPPDRAGDASSAPSAAGRDAAPADRSAAPAALPEEVVVSTNEPFYQARVARDELVLTGVDVGERRMRVRSSTVEDGVRVVVAEDAAGRVEARVRDAPCQDDMSGAEFPLSGELAVDGGDAHRGCVRPASMPPPGEPRQAPAPRSIPERFVGRWAPDEAGCRDPAGTIEGVAIEPDAIRFHESLGVPRSVVAEGERAVRVVFAYEGEGERWESEQVLRLDDRDALEILGPGETRLRRIRCAQ